MDNSGHQQARRKPTSQRQTLQQDHQRQARMAEWGHASLTIFHGSMPPQWTRQPQQTGSPRSDAAKGVSVLRMAWLTNQHTRLWSPACMCSTHRLHPFLSLSQTDQMGCSRRKSTTKADSGDGLYNCNISYHRWLCDGGWQRLSSCSCCWRRCASSRRQLGLIPHGQLHALQQVVVQPIQRARKAVNADAHYWHRLCLFRAGQSGITRAISLAESRTRSSCARPACQALQYNSPPDAWHTWVASFEPLRTVANESPDMRRNDSAACTHVTAPLHCCSRQAMPGCTARHDVESSFASMSRYSVGQNATCTPQYPQVKHKRTAVLPACRRSLTGCRASHSSRSGAWFASSIASTMGTNTGPSCASGSGGAAMAAASGVASSCMRAQSLVANIRSPKVLSTSMHVCSSNAPTPYRCICKAAGCTAALADA